jgi:hypothetical protein
VTSKDGTEIAFEKSEVSAHETPPADMDEKLTEFFNSAAKGDTFCLNAGRKYSSTALPY